MNWNVPNILTLIRIGAIPLLMGLFFIPGWPGYLASTVVFVLAAITDWVDGYWARRYEQTSAFGAFLDPVADKLMVATALVLLTADGRAPAILTVIIIGREITISALREWMAELGKRAAVAVSWMGKLKTAAQMVAIVLLLLHVPIQGVNVHLWGLGLLTLAAILTLWSMILYLKAALPILLSGEESPAEGS
ncbi:CDP-diacylglycerol--glycerol-3-phosphate 3-phosphatidyltransferase [Thiohalorhabdus denitrificans]|uniref:CDP-diacylglycerol--glycerol-3-phosphate 3-phosphatidyltransferase n=1 Tax=Thiohalorhabdus denitrificans TaxID=381306 RepID=A0A1G5DQG9_9GAMM|nr:CDP-diacylglycerol--glycerol-3-phosphate 3-phosphatidyltransferase [Thiohalorhabdus denitrificans]SCY17033.1 CDP-diacylglycerol--glycerol-3-phosphate 3-phosphatidyltransferase [Thiohalorhabdus denitrificans]